MKHPFYLSEDYRREQSERTKKQWLSGVFDSKKKPPIIKNCANRDCTISFSTTQSNPKKYCSSRCAAIINNTLRIKYKKIDELLYKFCFSCNIRLTQKRNKYCSIKCQNNQAYKNYIANWKQGLVSGNKGIISKNLSHHLKRYLIEKYDNKCSLCGWNKKNPITGVVPVEVDHIDGNADNNKEENLRIICPNCHSLTTSYRNLNRGKGRAWRLIYLANHKVR